ncbi:hypothetical protein OEG84_08905 [Hoeflea sp. G2-23]|uniref:Uncharacterized protein n=1 Tax=Hoeflea algicola TaxID=2983763 RepID=A0ABT3Z7U3_9HYPH|nr:hypothetical protein [Hoeflea algicola]MCY0147827.1 hypothetical protein [Hoeflea algicola]
MQIPTWTKPALLGAAAGAVVLAIVGFSSYGGWVTGGTAQEMADKAGNDVGTQIVSALCVKKFVAAPGASMQLAKLKEAKSWDRDNFIEDGGWATIDGVEDGIDGVADACAEQLAAMDELPAAVMAPAADEAPAVSG